MTIYLHLYTYNNTLLFNFFKSCDHLFYVFSQIFSELQVCQWSQDYFWMISLCMMPSLVQTIHLNILHHYVWCHYVWCHHWFKPFTGIHISKRLPAYYYVWCKIYCSTVTQWAFFKPWVKKLRLVKLLGWNFGRR